MKTKINPPGTEHYYHEWEMSEGIRHGNIIWLSGKVGIDSNEKLCEGLEAQSRMAFERVRECLAEAGASMQDIVELVTYHVSMDDLETFMKVKSEFIPPVFPAWTAIGVSELYTPEALIEIKATAVVNENHRSGGDSGQDDSGQGE